MTKGSDANRAPCLRCDKPTNHASGICRECRERKCKTCGRWFKPNKLTTLICPNCAVLKRGKTRNYTEASLEN